MKLLLIPAIVSLGATVVVLTACMSNSDDAPFVDPDDAEVAFVVGLVDAGFVDDLNEASDYSDEATAALDRGDRPTAMIAAKQAGDIFDDLADLSAATEGSDTDFGVKSTSVMSTCSDAYLDAASSISSGDPDALGAAGDHVGNCTLGLTDLVTETEAMLDER